MNKEHLYTAEIVWTGNQGTGTSHYKDYSRSFDINITQKPTLKGSADPAFLGDAAKYNPEDMLLASLSSCHMLWYLHLCASNNIVVTEYKDTATAKMHVDAHGVGKFTEVVLSPIVTITNLEQIKLASELHESAHKFCFIANSVNFEVKLNPKINCSD